MLDSIWLTFRSLLWTILLPGFVAGYLPWQYFGVKDVRLDFSNPIHVGAVVVTGLGCGLLAWCILGIRIQRQRNAGDGRCAHAAGRTGHARSRTLGTPGTDSSVALRPDQV